MLIWLESPILLIMLHQSIYDHVQHQSCLWPILSMAVSVMSRASSLLVNHQCSRFGSSRFIESEVLGICKNITVKQICRNGGFGDVQEYYGQVDTQKWRCWRCTRILQLSRYIEMEMLGMRKNIMVKQIRRNGDVGDAQEYFGRI